MDGKKIKDKTVKDIFQALVGEENADNFLKDVQAAYDKGLTGETLKRFARGRFDEISGVDPASAEIAVAAIASSVG